MASLRLPDPLINGLTKILTLSDDSFQEFVSVLGDVPLKIKQHRVYDEQIISNIKTIPSDDAKSAAEAAFALHLGFSATEVPLENYVKDIAQSLKEARPDSTNWNEENGDRFRQRLTQLLKIEPTRLVAKSHEVLLEHYRTFYASRILTDIRPVFEEEIGSPSATVLVHTLKIEYMQNGDPKEFYVAMDTKDIEEFMKVLERAKSKTESLKAFLASANATYVDIV